MKTFGVVARIKAPEGYRGVWINIYLINSHRFQSGGSYQTRKQADSISKQWRHDCIYAHVRINGTGNRRV